MTLLRQHLGLTSHPATQTSRYPMAKCALITGITGQDGSYLAELLLAKGYEVHGIIRRASSFNTGRIEHIYEDRHNSSVKLYLHYGELGCDEQLTNLVYNVRPDEIYHLGAQSHVKVSFDMPQYTADVTGVATVRMLEAIRRSGINARFYQASSSEMFGSSPPPQNETSAFHPRSPYGAAKVYAYWITVNYREAYGLFAVNGILFNHESPRRGATFVTRKVTRAVANIIAGRQSKVYLGNLDAHRDWGYAPEYVEGMWRILQHDNPEDFVLGTGESHSVRELCEIAFSYVGLDWQAHVELDPQYRRPTEVNVLLADASKANHLLAWRPKITFNELVHIMVDADLESLGLMAVGAGKRSLEREFATWHTWQKSVSPVLTAMAGAH
jgi:GDPmannose 4,6-dehydratase